jgi:spermidine synthase
MLSGTTNHGVQSVDPSLRCEPLSYYSRGGPVGQILDGLPGDARTRRIGVVGLGTASMAAYAQAGQSWTFYEINPVVERLARDPQFFTYLRDCGPDARVVTGDARLMLAREPDGAFDVLVLDAFSSDAIPVHLMTLEALQLYFSKLSPNGVVAMHISNRFMRLAPVVASVARRAGYVGLTQLHVPTSAQRAISAEIVPSRWAVLARRTSDLGPLATDGRWESLDNFEGPVWTDDYSNVIGVMQR